MQENAITGVNKVAIDPTMNVSNSTPGLEGTAGAQKMAAAKNESVSQTESHSSLQSQQQPSSPSGITDVRLKFEVNPETNDVTCMVIDRASKKIIRTIPPDELKNLQEGDLVQLYT